MPQVRLLARIGGVRERWIEASPGETLLSAVARAGLPLGQSCRGEGICRSCALRVLGGADRLTAPPPIELRAGLDVPGGWRLACQAALVAGADDPPSAAPIIAWHPAWGEALPPDVPA